MSKIREMPVFGNFSEEEFRKALSLSKILHYEPGEYIIDEGSRDTTVYLLLSGSVRIVKNDREVTLIRRRGDIFGEMSALGDFPRSASAYAVSETDCIATDILSLEKLSGKDRLAFSCMLYRVFSEILAERLRSTTEELAKAKKELVELKKGVGDKNLTRKDIR
jgi:CRP-like cAMP-binding protein